MTQLYGIYGCRYNYRATLDLFHSSFAAETHRFAMLASCTAQGYAVDYFTLEVRQLSWQEREHCLLEGCYERPPWDLPPITDHYAHISLDDPSQIAFTDNPAHGEANRQTRMRPGKYVRKFYPNLSEKEIAFYAEWWVKGDKPRVPVDGELQFASDPDTIVQVYAEGPHSCMKGMDCVRVYGAGDLAIAYVRQNGKVISRALCWPEEKVFGRVYPNTCSWLADGFKSEAESRNAVEDLYARLATDLGWRSTAKYGDSLFYGARLLMIERKYRGHVMPYLDHCNVTEHADGDFWVLSECGYAGANTDGTLDGDGEDEDEDEDEDEPYATCEHCGDSIWNEDGAHDAYRSYGRVRSYTLCYSCYDRHTFYCEGTKETYYDQTNEHVEVSPCGSTYHRDCAEKHCFESDSDGEWYMLDRRQEMVDGEVWASSEVMDRGLYCASDGKFYSSDHWLTQLADEYPLLTQPSEMKEAA